MTICTCFRGERDDKSFGHLWSCPQYISPPPRFSDTEENRWTFRTPHRFEPDADGECYRCEFPADETEVHTDPRLNPVIVEGEEVIGWVEPFTSFRDDVA